jgi:hypothetical protein
MLPALLRSWLYYRDLNSNGDCRSASDFIYVSCAWNPNGKFLGTLENWISLNSIQVMESEIF